MPTCRVPVHLKSQPWLVDVLTHPELDECQRMYYSILVQSLVNVERVHARINSLFSSLIQAKRDPSYAHAELRNKVQAVVKNGQTLDEAHKILQEMSVSHDVATHP